MTNWPGPKLTLVVREFCLEADRTGLLVDLVVDHLQHAGVEFRLTVGREGLGGQLSGGDGFGQCRQLLLRQREEH